jgi:hypothetical protein
MSVAPPESASATTNAVHRVPEAAPAVGVLTILPLAFLAIFVALSEVDGGEAASAPPTPAFDEVFEPAGRVTLEETGSKVVSRVRTVAVRGDGVLAVADPRQDRVWIYGADGDLLVSVGGTGSGPGELDFPGDVAFDARGRLYVAESGQPRVSRFERDFAFDTLFRVENAYFPTEIGSLGDRLVVYANRPGVGAEALRLYTPEGEALETFHPEREEYGRVPYWGSASRRVMAVSSSRVVAGGNLLYPFPVYGPDGTLRDSIGTPPGSWKPAPRPERGQFTGPDQIKQFEKWRRTFTMVDNVAIYRDSLLVVSHKELNPDVLAYEEATYRADVYRLGTGRKLVEDVLLPGRLLRGGEHLHLLLSSPPDPWSVGRYEVDAGAVGP